MASTEQQLTFNNSFKLQGKSFNTTDELLFFAEKISNVVYAFLCQWFDENAFVEVKTSGSTGTPKVISLQKKYMLNSALATGEFFNLPENTSALLCMSPNFIAGKMMLVRALVLGWDLDIVAPVSNPLEGIEKQYDFCAMVPLQLHNSLDEIHKIEKLIVGGGIVSKDLLHKIQSVKTEIFATYGMTETITHIAVKKLNHIRNVIASETKQSFYKVLPNIAISIDNRNCLIIKAPKVSDEIIITNDVVDLISSTEFDWLGRYDSIVNSGGIKLIPEQIELKITELISERFFVAGIPDAVLGEKLILVIEDKVTERSGSDKNKKDKVISTPLNHRDNILQKLKQLKALSKFELPKEIYFLKAFIDTETQKINRPKTLTLLASK